MSDLKTKIASAQEDLKKAQDKLKMLHQEMPLEEVKDYSFTGPSGPATLSQLFGNKDELLLIHNMGKKCPYCTLWADGLIGFTSHIEDRTAFVLTSPDDFSTLDDFAKNRNWNFNYVSTNGLEFQKDMGFWKDDHHDKGASVTPGFSTFLKKDGKILRKTHTWFGPGDLYCSIWHFFDLLPKGTNDWTPKYTYSS